eukprot:195174_1
MNAEQKQNAKQLSHKGRSLSRQILGNDLDLVNKYASKYGSPSAQSVGLKRNATYTAMPNAYGGGYGGYAHTGYGGNTAYGHGYGSGSGSSTGSGYNSNNNTRTRRRAPSNLINGSSSNQWDANTMNNQEQDMSAAMTAMVSSYQTRVTEDASFLDEMQYEADQDENFAAPERAEDWSVKEVCFWLNRIHLDKYIKPFRDQIIDGSILLRDLDEAMLINELGIKRLHVKKILREISKLKNKSPKLKKESNNTRDELIQSLRSEIDELKQKNKQLNTELQMIKVKASYSNYSAKKY